VERFRRIRRLSGIRHDKYDTYSSICDMTQRPFLLVTLMFLLLFSGILPSASAQVTPDQAAAKQPPAPEPAVHPLISRIAFGSCQTQDEPLPILRTVLEWEPELFIYLGDNIYGDTNDMAVLEAKYAKMGPRKTSLLCEPMFPQSPHGMITITEPTMRARIIRFERSRRTSS
jgi:hypothetical protein